MELCGQESPENVFAGREGDRIYAADGDIIRGRDRLLGRRAATQYALEYRGQFLDDKVTATVGLRTPYFERQLNQYCYTPNGGNGSSGTIGPAGGVLCTSRTPLTTTANGNVTFVPANPMTPTVALVVFIPPYSETVEFDEICCRTSVCRSAPGIVTSSTCRTRKACQHRARTTCTRPFATWARPRSRARRRNRRSPSRIDLGWRLNHPTNIASLALYQIDYTNRIVSTFNADLGYNEDRNVGDATIVGLDAQFGHRFGDALALTLGASYNDSELEGSLNPALDGKKLVETPEWTYTARMDLDVTEDVKFGLQAKKVGDRFSTDLNDEIAPGYTVVDVDLNWGFGVPGLRSRRAAAQRHEPARRRIFRQHQLGHGRHLGGLLLHRCVAHGRGVGPLQLLIVSGTCAASSPTDPRGGGHLLAAAADRPPA